MVRDPLSSRVVRVAVAAFLAGCSANAPQGSEDAAAPPPVPVEKRREIIEKAQPAVAPRRAPQPDRGERTVEAPPALLALFKEDLSRRALVKPETITVVSAVEVEWPDGALGCGRPGEVYTQMIVPGYRVVLNAGGHDYAYHSDRRGRFIVCTSAGPAAPVSDQTGAPPPTR